MPLSSARGRPTAKPLLYAPGARRRVEHAAAHPQHGAHAWHDGAHLPATSTPLHLLTPGTQRAGLVDVRTWVERPYTPKRITRIEIDHAALQSNIAAIRGRLRPETQLCAVLKANAYGHGAVEVARVALASGVDRFAVATVEEGVELRKSGITAPILVLGYSAPAEADDVVAFSLTATVCSLEAARALDAAAVKAGGVARVHVKVNTGMNRLGVRPAEAAALLTSLRALEHVDVEGIFTHFHSADVDLAATRAQLAHFTALLDELTARGLRPRIAHAANSAATLALPESHLDMVRPGTALHGFFDGGRPTLAWKTGVAHVNTLAKGESVGYGATWRAPGPRTVAVLPVGWADGIGAGTARFAEVLVNGVRCPVVGTACMDQCIVDVTQAGPVAVGAEVVLVGAQGADAITARQAAAWLGASDPVQLTARISRRCPSSTSGAWTALSDVPFTTKPARCRTPGSLVLTPAP